MKVKKLIYNWHYVGSVNSNDGCGEDYSWHEVGQNGIISIEEISATERYPFHYLVCHEDGTRFLVFNPNYVICFPLEKI